MNRSLPLTLLALVAVGFCSCRGPGGRGRPQVPPAPPAAAPGYYNSLPDSAFTGDPYGGSGFGGHAGCLGCAAAGGIVGDAGGTLVGPWRPDGISGPWPADEYLHDGGDEGDNAGVLEDFTVRGLEAGDTIAHYDTLDGRTIIKPSNRVCLYAPRFGSVRSVQMITAREQHDQANDYIFNDGPRRAQENLLATTTLQRLQANRQVVAKSPTVLLEEAPPLAATGEQGVAAYQDALMPYENFEIIRTGVMDSAEKAFIAKSVDAAIIWTADQAVQVMLGERWAGTLTGDQRAQATFTLAEPDSPSLCILKLASTCTALPGETVDFTLRFDNTGDQVIGNVVIVDNLVTRLEYVVDSQRCSRKAEFATQRNSGDSLALRWQLAEPLRPGEGGVIRFRCKVR